MSEPLVKIERAPDRPPLFGRWKIYIDGDYIGSAPTKAQAEQLAKQSAGRKQ